MGKTVKNFRMMRLLRIAKAEQIMNLVIEQLPSENLMIVYDITKLILAVLAGAHLVACIWYGTAGFDTDGADVNWVVHFGYHTKSLSRKYIMCLRWALSQFSGGMDEIVPTSLAEHVFAAFTFTIAYWSGNVIVSLLTSNMTRCFMASNHQTQQLVLIRQYLLRCGVSKHLSLRVHRNAQHTIKHKTRVSESEIGLESLVSFPLRVELHFEMYAPHLACHPWFNRYLGEFPHVVRKICHQAMSINTSNEGDVVFHYGEVAASMFICKAGTLRYTWGVENEVDLKSGNWICEAGLWVAWAHRGDLMAIELSTHIELAVSDFQDIVSRFIMARLDPARYAQSFADSLNKAHEEVTDLPLRGSGGWRDFENIEMHSFSSIGSSVRKITSQIKLRISFSNSAEGAEPTRIGLFVPRRCTRKCENPISASPKNTDRKFSQDDGYMQSQESVCEDTALRLASEVVHHNSGAAIIGGASKNPRIHWEI